MSTTTLRTVADIWCEVLGVPQVGADDDFFELGGDSIAVAKVLGRIRLRIRPDANLDLLFDNPMLSDLATALDRLKS